jgi:hypothetical protein
MPSIATYASLSDRDLLTKLADMSRHSGKAALVLAALTDDDWYRAVTELRRRCARSNQALIAEEASFGQDGRMLSPYTVEIDKLRWRTYWTNKRIRIGEVGPLVGLCRNWASTISCKGKASLLTLERIAVELNVDSDDFVWAVSTDAERDRLARIR